MEFRRVVEWYSRESVQKALLEIAKNREVVCVYEDKSFGKRPDTIQYPADILQAVAEGAVAFHGSVERWKDPMRLDVTLTKEQLDELRIGWDLLIDPDVEDFEIAKIATKVIVEALKEHGIKNFSIKFTGGKGFHISVPFESFPERINYVETRKLYPDLFEKIIFYLKDFCKERLREELLSIDTPINLAKRAGKSLSETISEDGLDPFKIVNLDVFGSRHLFRLPYSLHESTLLVSLPLDLKDLEKFEREDANPEIVKVEKKFLQWKFKLKDAESLVVEALDWASRNLKRAKMVYEEVKAKPLPRRVRKIGEKYFPPCIKKILSGLDDGRKRSVFILVTFLRNMGWKNEEIEEKIWEWNEKNLPPLRESFIRCQLRWHFRQERNLLPPNCDNPTFFKDFGVCQPDEICLSGIKNPLNYPFKKMALRRKKIK